MLALESASNYSKLFFKIEIRFPFNINLTTRTSWSTEPPFKTIGIEVKA